MQHLSILMIILSTLVGAATIARTFSVYAIFKLKFLKFFSYFLLLVLLANISDLLFNYLFLNDLVEGLAWKILAETLSLSLTFAGIANLILSIKELTNKRLKTIWMAFLLLGASLLSTVLYNSLTSMTGTPPLPAVTIIVFQILLYVIYVLLAGTIIYYCRDSKGAKKFAKISFGVLVVARPSLDFILNLAHRYDVITYFTFLISQFAVELITYLLILIFIKKFATVISSDNSEGGSNAEKLSLLGISQREKDVIDLVLAGLSNQEISEKLNISILTVKDHIYNIYKKTNVKNRVQLTNLFKI